MVNTRAIAAEYRLTHWAGIIQERAESGLSIKAYCLREDICQNTYYYWQRKLREAACEKLIPAHGTVNVTHGTEVTNTEKSFVVPDGWAMCEATSEVASEEKMLTIEINGFRLPVSTGTDLELLTKICRVLVSLC